MESEEFQKAKAEAEVNMMFGRLNTLEPSKAIKTKVASQFALFGPEEVRPHMLTHQPCRKLCKSCVQGKAVDVRHSMADREGQCHVISMDYIHFTKRGDDAVGCMMSLAAFEHCVL